MRVIVALALAMVAAPVQAQTFNANIVAATHTYAGDYGAEPGAPRLFSIHVAPGYYRATVTLGLPKLATETTTKAESRRLTLDAVDVRPRRPPDPATFRVATSVAHDSTQPDGN